MNDTITTVPVVRTCQFCGNTTKIHVNLDTNAAYIYYSVYHMGYIQNVPVDNFEKEHCKAIVREFLKTGICLDCQKLIFGGNEQDYEEVRAYKG